MAEYLCQAPFCLGKMAKIGLYYPAMNTGDPPSLLRLKPLSIDVPEGGVRVIESRHAPDFKMEPGIWPFHKLGWVAIGRGFLETDTQLEEIRKDDFLVIPAGRRHRFSDEPRSPMTLVIFCFSEVFIARGERADLWRNIAPQGASARIVRARTRFHHAAIVELLRNALKEQHRKERGWETLLGAYGDDLLVRFVRCGVEASLEKDPKNMAQAALRGAREFIDANPQRPWQIAEVAESCGLSPRRFTDLFKKLTGETFNHYLSRRRIEFACKRLKETQHILYACYESGFSDPAYFYRVFRKQTGKTPGEFVRAAQSR